jgi:hypothetical protein
MIGSLIAIFWAPEMLVLLGSASLHPTYNLLARAVDWGDLKEDKRIEDTAE